MAQGQGKVQPYGIWAHVLLMASIEWFF